MMNQVVKIQWVAALRSGAFEQGRSYLNRDGKMCCLGVLCHLAEQEGIVEAQQPWSEECESPVSYIEYNGCSALLPGEVMEWAGLTDNCGDMIDGRALTSYNDATSAGRYADPYDSTLTHLYDFNKIADLIERHL